ncbi:MAG: FAD-dependent monooxygenase, partial [Flavobacteriales bacterium]|nr:FAD-dependent monooxygenase [Flavobacteriales bacterium]
LSSLAIVRCYPWTHGKTALMGDAAHATVPFYGQGMNCGFEDCTVMWELMQKHGDDWNKIFEDYQLLRKPDGDGVQDLSLHNYHVMRDYVADPMFLLQKKIEAHFSEKHPDKWMPLYSQVTFSHIRYSEAWKTGQKQDAIMKRVMAKHNNINEIWNSTEIENEILNELNY